MGQEIVHLLRYDWHFFPLDLTFANDVKATLGVCLLHSAGNLLSVRGLRRALRLDPDIWSLELPAVRNNLWPLDQIIPGTPSPQIYVARHDIGS